MPRCLTITGPRPIPLATIRARRPGCSMSEVIARSSTELLVARIQAQEFRITRPPEAAICKECDLRGLCRADGIITAPEASA